MTDQEFRERLAVLGYSQSSFARALIEMGDPRPFTTVLRAISNYCRGATGVPPEMPVILRMMEVAGVRAPAPLAVGRPRRLPGDRPVKRR